MECKKCGKNNPEDAVFCCSCGNALKETTSNSTPFVICSSCKTPNPSGSEFCKYCGLKQNNISGAYEREQFGYRQTKTNADKLIWKVICILGGLIGAGVGGYTIYSDTHDYWFGYDYKPPLSDHEWFIYGLLAVSIIIFLIGCSISSSD